MKIALVKAPWWVRYCPPYILAYFATYLRGQGHEAFVFDLNNSLYHAASPEHRAYWDDRDQYSFWENPASVDILLDAARLDAVVDRIIGTGADVAAFTTHTTSVLMSYAVARRLKEKKPSCVVIFFGHKASRAQMAFDFINQPFIDYVCPGEADRALSALLSQLENRAQAAPLPSCKGFLSKQGGKIIDGGAADVVEDLDTLPFPDYRDFADDIRHNTYSQQGRLDILDSRGCVNDCKFCYERLFWPKYRSMSGKRIFEQIKFHRQSFPQVNYFYFNGLLLNGSLKNLEEFCDLVIADGMKITWAGQAVVRPDMDRSLLMKMRKAGCAWLGFGVESGSQRILDLMGKRCNIEKAVEVLKNTREAGIAFQVNIMFGFPTETEEDFQQTLKFLVHARPYLDSVLASQSFFTLEKETYVRTHSAEFGITNADHHLFWKSNNGANNYAERFRRYEEFCKLAISLGLPQTSGVLTVKPDKWFLLGQYYQYEQDFGRAAECFERSLSTESDNATTRAQYEACRKKAAQ